VSLSGREGQKPIACGEDVKYIGNNFQYHFNNRGKSLCANQDDRPQALLQ